MVAYARRRGALEVRGEVVADILAILDLPRSLDVALRRDPDEPDATPAVRRSVGPTVGVANSIVPG